MKLLRSAFYHSVAAVENFLAWLTLNEKQHIGILLKAVETGEEVTKNLLREQPLPVVMQAVAKSFYAKPTHSFVVAHYYMGATNVINAEILRRNHATKTE